MYNNIHCMFVVLNKFICTKPQPFEEVLYNVSRLIYFAEPFCTEPNFFRHRNSS